MKKAVTFGEIMLRLQPYHYERFVQCGQVEFSFGGAEANVAVSLANYGLASAYVTKLPPHDIGQAAINSLRRYGVDTSGIARGGERIGIYFNEKGADHRASACIYDRAHSAMSEASPADFDWDSILDGADWFHFTGITPALGGHMAEITRIACQAAKAKGIKISCDLNYRAKLWTPDEARRVMTDLIPFADVFMTNCQHAEDILGITPPAGHTADGLPDEAGCRSVAKQLSETYGFEKVAITLRRSLSAFDNRWGALLYDKDSDTACVSRFYDLHMVDRIGGGDAFCGGLIYSLLTEKSLADAVAFAAAACALKHSVSGDYNIVTVDEVEKLARGDGLGRVQR